MILRYLSKVLPLQRSDSCILELKTESGLKQWELGKLRTEVSLVLMGESYSLNNLSPDKSPKESYLGV